LACQALNLDRLKKKENIKLSNDEVSTVREIFDENQELKKRNLKLKLALERYQSKDDKENFGLVMKRDKKESKASLLGDCNFRKRPVLA